MSKYEITKPIGLSNLCNIIEDVCNNAKVYRCGLKPKHLIVPLNSGSGRTTFVEYLTDMYKKHGILDFSGSLDDYIEVTIDGCSSRSITQGFANFRSGAIYRNDYSGVAAINVEGMAKYLSAPQFADFIKETKELCRNAYVVFFVNSEPSSSEEKLIEKIVDGIGKDKIHRAVVEKYTPEEICYLIEKTVDEHGVKIKQYQMFHTSLIDLVLNYDITKVKDAVSTAECLIHNADFSRFTPVVSNNSITAMAESWNIKTKRSENK